MQAQAGTVAAPAGSAPRGAPLIRDPQHQRAEVSDAGAGERRARAVQHAPHALAQARQGPLPEAPRLGCEA